MIMQKIFCLFLILTAGIHHLTYAQFSIPKGSAEELAAFKDTKLMVVYDKQLASPYNLVIEDAIKEHWELTEYECIQQSEFEDLRKREGLSFLVINQVYFESDPAYNLYDYLVLSLGGDYRSVNDMPTLCAVPLAYHNGSPSNYAYKAGSIVEFMQKHIRLCMEHPELDGNKILKLHQKNGSYMRNKILLLRKEDVEKDLQSENAIRSCYEGKVQLSNKDAISELITQKDTNYVYLHRIGPEGYRKNGRCFKLLINTGNADLYYFDQHKIKRRKPNAWLKKDFRNINKELGK